MNSTPPASDFNSEEMSRSDLAPANTSDCLSTDSFTEGEVMRIDLYEEIPNLDREIVVRENVPIKQILIQESADVQP